MKEAKLGRSTSQADVIQLLSPLTEGFSGAQLKAVCEEAEWLAFGEDDATPEGITLEHYRQALERVKEISSHRSGAAEVRF
jgi:ATP-dependent 26S proteasome regulatory subunit